MMFWLVNLKLEVVRVVVGQVIALFMAMLEALLFFTSKLVVGHITSWRVEWHIIDTFLLS